MRCRRAELLLLVGCVHAAAPRVLYNGADDTHWTYDLRIDGSRFTQLIHQADGTRCTQAGTIEQMPTEILRTFQRNDCNPAYVGKTVHDLIVERSATRLVVRMEGNYLIRYDRAP